MKHIQIGSKIHYVLHTLTKLFLLKVRFTYTSCSMADLILIE